MSDMRKAFHGIIKPLLSQNDPHQGKQQKRLLTQQIRASRAGRTLCVLMGGFLEKQIHE